MAVTIFAAIDVGSHETTLRIYEVSKKVWRARNRICTPHCTAWARNIFHTAYKLSHYR